MDEWDDVCTTLAMLAEAFDDMANAPIDFEREVFLVPPGTAEDDDDRWDFEESLRCWLEENDYLQAELIWMEFHLDTPLRADRFRNEIQRWLALLQGAMEWPLLGEEEFRRRVAQLKKDLLSCADYCVELHNLMLRLADKKADTQKKSVPRLPRNPLVLKLAREVQKRAPRGESREEIAREIADGDARQADSILRQLRRYPHLTNGEDKADT